MPLDRGGRRRFGTGLKNPNFASMAEAVGIGGIGLEDPARSTRESPRHSLMTVRSSSMRS
jgi:thiamine pyrophosphate-dependent acetolactate synthase large subunit-like protein